MHKHGFLSREHLFAGSHTKHKLVQVTDTVEAARHAVSKEWILEEDIAHIAEEKSEDERKPERNQGN